MPSKRLTRSQAKKNKESLGRCEVDLSNILSENLIEEERSQPTRSSETSESIVKLAKESLEVGRLLGMTVIDKERQHWRELKKFEEQKKESYKLGGKLIYLSIKLSRVDSLGSEFTAHIKG